MLLLRLIEALHEQYSLVAITNDIYTLDGFTAAYNKLINNC